MKKDSGGEDLNLFRNKEIILFIINYIPRAFFCILQQFL